MKPPQSFNKNPMPESEIEKIVKPHVLRCRPGDWEHTQRVVALVKTIGKDYQDISLIIVAAYAHDLGWRDLVDPHAKLSKRQIQQLESQANKNTEPVVKEVLASHYQENQINQILRLIGAADAHKSRAVDEAILVDADNLSKLSINHLKEKFHPSSWHEWFEYWQKVFPNRLETDNSLMMAERLFKKLKIDIDNYFTTKMLNNNKKVYTIKQNQIKNIQLTQSGTYTIKLVGEAAHVNIKGKFNLKQNESLKLNVIIIHAAAYTSADTLLKAVVDDQAKVELYGTIIVEKGAQQTNSFLTEKVLLLSPRAQAHAIPNLEIEADDVKCSHAATVATLDELELFYLQSRGIKLSQAKAMIAQGFLAD